VSIEITNEQTTQAHGILKQLPCSMATATTVIKYFIESLSGDQAKQLAEEHGFNVGKRVMFVPSDESTYPPPFVWVKTSLGFGMHRYLTDTQRSKDETWDCWSFVEDNKDEATRFIGYNTDEPDTEVEWWEPML